MAFIYDLQRLFDKYEIPREQRSVGLCPELYHKVVEQATITLDALAYAKQLGALQDEKLIDRAITFAVLNNDQIKNNETDE